MEERVARIVVEVVELVGEVVALREEMGREVREVREALAVVAAEDGTRDWRVLVLAALGLVVGLGHLAQGWWGRRGGRDRKSTRLNSSH